MATEPVSLRLTGPATTDGELVALLSAPGIDVAVLGQPEVVRRLASAIRRMLAIEMGSRN